MDIDFESIYEEMEYKNLTIVESQKETYLAFFEAGKRIAEERLEKV